MLILVLKNGGIDCVLGLFEKEEDENQVDAKEYDAPPPHPPPPLAADDVARSHRPQIRTRKRGKEVPPIHGGVLVDKEQVGNGDLHNSLANGAAQSGEDVAEVHVRDILGAGHPHGTGKLRDGAENVQRSPSVLVREREEEDAAHGQAGVVGRGAAVQGVDAEAQLILVLRPCCEANVQLDESEEYVNADEAKVDVFAPWRPVERVIRIRRWDWLQKDAAGGALYF